MSETREALKDIVRLESEAAEGIGAAKAEQEIGQPALSLGLLREAVEKERAGLDLLDDAVGTLRQALDQRRQALDQQAEILDQVTTALAGKRRI
jgi:hypothetical protein